MVLLGIITVLAVVIAAAVCAVTSLFCAGLWWLWLLLIAFGCFLALAALAFGLLWLLYDLMVARLAVVDTLKLLSFVPFGQLVLPMVIVFSLAGMFVGVVGSWFSIRKFMDV